MPTTTSRRVERVMGTAVSLNARSPVDAAVVDEAMKFLHWVDRTFSVYRPASDISRIARGELSPDDASPEVREVLGTCETLRHATDGWFEHEPRGHPDRSLDPSGYVKGWAIERAAEIIRFSGADRFCISAGGDLMAVGTPNGDGGWRVGIRHPDDAHRIAATVIVSDGAVATSATYERGEHIWTEASGSSLRSVSVVGPSLATADALATAVFAAGRLHLDWLLGFPEYGILAVDRDLRLHRSPWIELA
jgi:thiamine biosynthesis lipoprotein